MTTARGLPPTPVDWRQLVQAGYDLLDTRRGVFTPTGGHVRRAISNAYYALFHALAESNADMLIGSPGDALAVAAWSRIYRGLDHSPARRELRRHRHEFSAPARNFADTFDLMQQLRHSADYDHTAVITAQEARGHLSQTEAAILGYLQSSVSERLYIATLTLIRPR